MPFARSNESVAITAVMDEMRQVLPRALREAARKQGLDARLRSGTVEQLGEDVAYVHMDGDDVDVFTPALIVGAAVDVGDRVMVMFAGDLCVTIGTIGGSSTTGGVITGDFVTHTEFGSLVAAYLPDQFRVHTFALRGDASAQTADYESPVFVTETPIGARVVAKDPPTGSSMTFDFSFNGADVLGGTLDVPTGSASNQPFTSTSFALGQLVPTLGGGSLRGVCVAADTGNTGGRITLSLFTKVG
jgi:hypothetical protein